MIKHIIKLIWNQRKSNSWLLGELLLVTVCLWYIVDYLLVVLYTFSAPVGFDLDHTYKFEFNAREEGAEGYLGNTPPKPVKICGRRWSAYAGCRAWKKWLYPGLAFLIIAWIITSLFAGIRFRMLFPAVSSLLLRSILMYIVSVPLFPEILKN